MKSPGLCLVDKRAVPLPEQAKLKNELEGIVILDGTWSQAKTLWWRNAWLLKLGRVVVAPHEPSIYGKLRKDQTGAPVIDVYDVGDDSYYDSCPKS